MRLPDRALKRNSVLLGVLVLILSLSACSAGDLRGSSVLPEIASGQNAELTATGSHHWLWGYWEGFIPESHHSIELLPVRMADIHLNARRLLEETACDDCIQVLNVEIDQTQGTIIADIQLRHPFPGLDRFTAFDVRGVVISDGSSCFPALDATVPDASLGDCTLLNPDGYTRLWNTLEFPPGSGPFKILEYSQGKFAAPGDFTGTVNPFIEFGQWPRSHFPAGGTMVRQFVLKLVPGAIRFGYAVDASWEPPSVDPPLDIQFDFPSSANALEPNFESWDVTTVPYDIVGSEGEGTASLFDRQGWETVQGAYLECPDLWTGAIEADSINYEDSTTGGDLLTAEFTFANEFGASAGYYPALLKVVDSVQDSWLGDINHMYRLVTIQVTEYQEPQLEGEMVFIAPGPPDPTGFGTANVFHLDLETMVETQLTSLVGIGMSVSEPRMNPKGTHMLCATGPSGYYTWISVMEIGVGECGSTPGPYDCSGDFHPDGERILSASATDVFEETLDLYSWKYDGAEQTPVATASESIRNPRWSPDGSRVVMTLGMDYAPPPSSELWIYDVATEEFTEIMSAPGIDDHPCWTPVPIGGHFFVAFDSTRDHFPDGESDIYVVNPDTEEILFHLDTGANEVHPSFSPDGLSFVFSMVPEDEEDSELFVCTWQTGGLTQLTHDDTYDSSPSWGWNW